MSETIHQSANPDKSLTTVDKLRMLLDITKKISRSLDLDEILTLVMDTLDSLLPYDAAGIYLIDTEDQSNHIFHAKALRGYQVESLEFPDLKEGEGFLGYVAQTGKTIICHNVAEDSRYFRARELTKSEMVAPIFSNDKVIGVFDLESDNLNAYTEDDLQVLLLLSSQVALIIEKVMLYEQLIEKQRLQGQLETARQVQLALLPDKDPQVEGFDISAYNYSTEEVSGDYYDWVKIYDDQIGVVLADAAGKGIPAALLMAFLRASLRFGALAGYAPHISMTKVNSLLWDSTERHQFVTAIYGIFDGIHRTFAFTNAGHNPPVLLRTNGEADIIKYGDLPLGMFQDSRYHQHFLRFREKEILLLYTDGITEAENIDGEEFGLDRVIDILRENRDLTAKELIKKIHQSVIEFIEGNTLTDDATLFVIKAV